MPHRYLAIVSDDAGVLTVTPVHHVSIDPPAGPPPTVGGGPVEPPPGIWGGGSQPHPDHDLPVDPPSVDNTLPPVSPGSPSNPIAGLPDVPSGAFILVWVPGQGLKWAKVGVGVDNTLPGSPGAPTQPIAPTPPGAPDQGLPPVTPPPVAPDQGLPPQPAPTPSPGAVPGQ